MKTLQVELGSRSYPIFIGQGLLAEPDCILPYIRGKQVLIVSNTTVAPLYLERVKSVLAGAGLSVESHLLPDGEAYKDIQHASTIFDTLLARRFDRRCTLLALGGGVVGDMTGFAAACYQRGVGFLQVPTTLLAQVDSSVGGKTGVNHPLGKNMIGAFKQPSAVVIDTDVLKTLPDRELSAGLAEVIKYGLIRDPDFLAWLEAHMEGLLARDESCVSYAIAESCRHKAEVVAADELEDDQRALLNLGHTFGHAIEAGMGYGNWLHGEAVAAGMVLAAELSCRMGWIEVGDVDRLRRLLERARLPVCPPAMSVDEFMAHMQVDKKVQDGRLRLILFKPLGRAVITDEAPEALIRETLTAALRSGTVQ